MRDCTIGHFCPEATPKELPCEPGTACTKAGLAVKDKDCKAGSYCLTGATKDEPTLPAEGGKCPCGHYCPAAAKAAIPCSLDKWNDLTGKSAPADCKACTVGKECPTRGLCAV